MSQTLLYLSACFHPVRARAAADESCSSANVKLNRKSDMFLDVHDLEQA
jgi:hypothetical protein